MGGVCSIDADGDKSLDEFSFDDNGFEKNDHKQFRYNPKAPSKNKTTPIVEDTEKKPCKRGSTLCEKGLNSIFSVLKGPKLSKNLSQKLKTNKWKLVNQTKAEKNVFIIFYSGERAEAKILKMCEAFGANRYPFTGDLGKQMQMI